MSETYGEAVTRWSVEHRKQVIDNPDVEFLGPYGITLDQKQAAIEEAKLLKPYRLYVFKHVTQLLNSLDIPWFLTYGTLLGWYRSKAMIAHDHDIDIAIVKEEDMLTVWKNRHRLPDDVSVICSDVVERNFNWCTDDECHPYDPSKGGVKKLLFTLKNPLLIPNNPIGYFGVDIEIYTYRLEEDGFRLNYAFGDLADVNAYHKSIVLPLNKSTFESVEVFVPNKPKEFLEIAFDYIGEDAVWDEATKLYKQRKQKQ